jgi:hypothetical protein
MKCVVASNFSHKTVAKALHGLHKVSLERNELFKACRYLNRAISYDMATDKSWLEPKNLLAAAEELMSGMNCLKAEREPLMQKITRILEGMGAGTQIALSEKRRLIALDVSGLIFDATFELDKKDYPNEYKESVRKKAGELTDKLEKLMPLQKSIS